MARLIVDTSGYLASVYSKHPDHLATRKLLTTASEPPVISPLVIAEIDYMVLDSRGVDQELAVLGELTSGAYELADVDVDDLCRGRQLAARHRDLKIGLTGAVNAVLADRYDTNEILTTDQRHFRVVTPLTRRFKAFRLLPYDS